MTIVSAVVVGMIVATVLAACHLALRWFDRRGWIYYGSEPKRPLGSRSAMALIEFETLLNPAAEHVLEYRRHGDLWVQESGSDGPDPAAEPETRG